MKLLILLISFACSLGAQNTLTLTGPSTTRPGSDVELVLSLAAPEARPAGLQWSLELPPNVQAVVAPGAAAVAAEKTLHCTTAGTMCLLVALNDTTIAPGEVARYTLAVPLDAAKGLYQIPLSGLVAGSAAAIVQPIAAGAAYEIRVLARSDLNGDGATNIIDLNLMLDQVLGRTACTDDQNGDGKCDLIDLLAVIRGALDE